MASNRLGRVSSEYMQALAACMRDVKDPRVHGIVSITRCEVTNDLRYAKVHISVLGNDRAMKEALRGLKSASGFLRREVARRVNLRAAPEPLFYADDSIKYGAQILSAINSIEKAPASPVVTVRYTMEDAKAFLMRSDDILILTHRRPDGDTLGCASGLCRALRRMEKTAYILKNNEVTPKYNFLIDGLEAPDDFNPAAVVSVDVADKSLLTEKAGEYAGRVDLSIDHHGSSRAFTRALWSDPSAAATGEMIFSLIKAMDVEVDREMASALYTAVSTDTGCFRYGNTTAATLRTASELVEKGAENARLNMELFEIKSPVRARLEGEVQSRMELFSSGRIALVKITGKMIREMEITDDDLDGISSIPRNIEGVDIGITITERAEGCKVSVRTAPSVDASAICSRFSGGGHKAAAGCTVQGKIDEAGMMLVKAAQEELD